MEFNNIFEVERRDYKGFVEQLIPKSYKVETQRLNKWMIATKVISLKTNKCLCSRVTYEERVPGEERQPEKYYIFEMPDEDERRAPIPKLHLNLETREEVQVFFNALAKQNKK